VSEHEGIRPRHPPKYSFFGGASIDPAPMSPPPPKVNKSQNQSQKGAQKSSGICLSEESDSDSTSTPNIMVANNYLKTATEVTKTWARMWTANYLFSILRSSQTL